MELIRRRTMTRNVVAPTCGTRTHPPGSAPARVKAPPGPPRPKYMEGNLKFSD